MKYTKANEGYWDLQVENADDWTIPVTREEYQRALAGELIMYLTPAKQVPADWFPSLTKAKVLGLASGGGQQGPIFAAHGADVTIMDLSDKQLETEQMVADREGYHINIIKGDMTETLPFDDGSFDLIFHPVSNCYIENIQHVWDECYRVLRQGGILLSGFSKEEVFMFEFDWEKKPPIVVTHPLPYNPLKSLSPEEIAERIRTGEWITFSHTLEEQIGGQIKAGFSVQGIYDDRDRGGVFARYMNCYAATKAVKI